jgi:2'-5' RNA ligase
LKTKVSFWLIPSEEDRAFFQEIIDTLSQEYDAPAFTPHVTIYSGEYAPDETPASLIEKATQGVQSFSLRVDNILYTDEFTKTLFVQFHASGILSQISEILRSSSRKPSDFALNPHLSLIYKQMSEETKKNLTTSLTLPKSEVVFNEVRAISTPDKVQVREDVESWKVIYTRKLQH